MLPAGLNKLFDVLRLHYEKEDPLLVREQIEKGIVFKGTNMWVLIFAIIVASVGLNMNSTAVVIGAMLISPLMGPINGVGYAVATYDFNLFQRSLKNLGFAVGSALTASTLYFLITPIHTEQSELLARTTPTIYDVFIALFGGLAGVVAMSSKNKGNVIPGVAIATALMPPLCTAGFGLATTKFEFFFGALYLFLINSVFIALSSLVVTHLLGYPKQTHLLKKEIKNKNLAIAVLLALTVLPSIYLGYTLVKREQFTNEGNRFVSAISFWDDNYLFSHNIDAKERVIELIYVGSPLDSSSISRLKDQLAKYDLDNAKLKVTQGLTIKDVPMVNQTGQEHSADLQRLQSTIAAQQRSIDSLQRLPEQGKQILQEAKVLFPGIHSCSFAGTKRYIDSSNTVINGYLVVFDTDSTLNRSDKDKVKHWLVKRLNNSEVTVRF